MPGATLEDVLTLLCLRARHGDDLAGSDLASVARAIDPADEFCLREVLAMGDPPVTYVDELFASLYGPADAAAKLADSRRGRGATRSELRPTGVTLVAELAGALLTSLGADAAHLVDGSGNMAKYDAADRQARGEPIPAEVQRLLSDLVAASTESGEVVDIYEATGIPKPSLDDLGDVFVQQAARASNAHLAIEALRSLLTEEAGRATGGNLVRQRTFSERIGELMNRYTNQQITSAEVIAELVELAREVASEGNRGSRFEPPLSTDELAFYDAVADNESAVELQGEDVLAQMETMAARELGA